jgi:sorbitol-specific phosphotransferase system component IIBC
LEILLHGDVDFHWTNEVKVLIVDCLSNARAHSRLYGGGCSFSQVCVGVGVGVSVGVGVRIGDASPKVALPLLLAPGNSVFP